MPFTGQGVKTCYNLEGQGVSHVYKNTNHNFRIKNIKNVVVHYQRNVIGRGRVGSIQIKSNKMRYRDSHLLLSYHVYNIILYMYIGINLLVNVVTLHRVLNEIIAISTCL